MELNVLERLQLMQVIPREGDFATLRIVRDMHKDLSFGEAEFKEFGIIQNEGRITWASSEARDIPIGEKATDIIVESLKKLDQQKQLTAELLPLYERFVEE